MPKQPSASAVVLLSAGLDSSFNLFKAHKELKVRLALTVNYGQRAARQEVACARRIAAQLGVPHKVVDLPWFREFAVSALLGGCDVPTGAQVRIDDVKQSQTTAASVWVPNRNGILLNIAAGFAEGLGASWVIPGFNREEAATFPDNTGEFLETLDACWSFSTGTQVRTRCYSTEMSKSEIVTEGTRIGLPFENLWPCYFDGEGWCGECESCQRYRRALAANGLSFEKLKR